MWWWANQILKGVAKPRDLATGIRMYLGGVSSQDQTSGILLLECHSRPCINNNALQIGP